MHVKKKFLFLFKLFFNIFCTLINLIYFNELNFREWNKKMLVIIFYISISNTPLYKVMF